MKTRQIIIMVTLSVIVGLTATPADSRSLTLQPNSFDSDNTADLVIGVPFEDVSVYPDNFQDAGAIHVLYGSTASGLSGTNDLFWHEGTTGVSNTPEPNEFFGRSLAIGDFNCDGRDDLAVGVPGQDLFFNDEDQVNAGAVHVFYADAGGLSLDGDEVWHQDIGSIQSISELGDQFGYVLAAGDFNGDTCEDLAVGSPYEDWNLSNSGIVHIIYGSIAGLTDLNNRLLRQGDGFIQDTEEVDDHFGLALATGYFNEDRYADLAIGVPGEDLGDPLQVDAGMVHVIYGSPGGMVDGYKQLFYEGGPGVYGVAEANEQFGHSLVSGNFDGVHGDELAVGVIGQMVAGFANEGAVHIFFSGSSGGLQDIDAQLDRTDLGITPVSESNRFGYALASSDFDRDGFSDLAIGVPNDEMGVNPSNAGVVFVLHGRREFHSMIEWLSPTPKWIYLYQGIYGVLGTAQADDYFGKRLAAGDFNGDTFADLAVSGSDEDPGSPSVNAAGSVNIIYGSPQGMLNSLNQLWYQGYNGLADQIEVSDQFGYALAAREYHPELIYLPLVMR